MISSSKPSKPSNPFGLTKRELARFLNPSALVSWRRLRGTAIGILSLIVLVLLIQAIVTPFYHKNAHLRLVSGDLPSDDVSLSTVVNVRDSVKDQINSPPDYVANDFNAMQRLSHLFAASRQPKQGQNSGDIERTVNLNWQTSLHDQSLGHSDVLMVFLISRAKISGNRVLFENGNDDSERQSFDDLLLHLKKSKAATKVLFLDVGRFQRDPSQGNVVNSLHEYIERAVKNSHDPHLWVLISNQNFEQSTISRSKERSIFGWLLERGLSGEADLNRDDQVDIRELHQFVSIKLDAWVRQATGGATTQTATLIWGGKGREYSHPVLLPVSNAMPVTTLSDDKHEKDDNDSSAAKLSVTFSEIWALRDALQKDPSDPQNPAFAAPKEWRLLQEHLIVLENSFRANPEIDLKQIIDEVTNLQKQLSELAKPDQISKLQPNPSLSSTPGTTTGSSSTASAPIPPVPAVELAPPSTESMADKFQSFDLIGKIRQNIARRPCRIVTPFSIGFAELLQKNGGSPIPQETVVLINEFDQSITADSAQQFQSWVKTNESKLPQFIETRLAKLLADDASLGWESIKLALQVCRFAEHTANTDLNCVLWMPPQFDQAEQLRKTAERTLLDQIGANRERLASSLFHQALDQYQQAADALKVVNEAKLLVKTLISRIALYVEWNRDSVSTKTGFDRALAIQNMSDQLQSLITQLAKGKHDEIPEIRQRLLKLRSLYEAIEVELSSDRHRGPAAISLVPGEQLAIENLLKTPLPDHQLRSRYFAAITAFDQRMDARFNKPLDSSGKRNANRQIDEVWELPLRQMQLEMIVPQLGATLIPELKQPLDRLDEAFNQTKQTFAKIKVEINSPQNTKELWNDYENWSQVLKLFYDNWRGHAHSLTSTTCDSQDPETHHRQINGLLSAERSLQLLPTRLIEKNFDQNPTIAWQQASLYHHLCWQIHRCEFFQTGSPSREADELTKNILSCRTQAANIPGQPPLPPLQPQQFDWKAPQSLSFDLSANDSKEFNLRWHGTPNTPVWITVHYDPELIDVEQISDGPIQFRTETEFVDPSTIRKGSAGWQLSPADRLPIRLSIKSLKQSTRPTRLIVYAATKNETARQDVVIASPYKSSLKMSVEGIPGSWETVNGQFRLFPFANRSTAYRFSIINQGKTDQTLSVKWVSPRKKPPEIPANQLSEQAYKTLITQIGLTDTLVNDIVLAVPSDGKPVVISPPPPTTKPETSAGSSELTPNWSDCILCVITNKTNPADIRYWIQSFTIQPQKPRRFLRPLVRYLAEEERIEITLTGVEHFGIPKEGVKVSATFLEPLPAGSARQLEAILTSTESKTKLFAEVPRRPGKIVTLQLSVDEYPRAFTYRIPCDRNTGDLPPVTDACSVVITEPSSNASFKTPRDTIPVEVRVDVPEGAFQRPGDLLEVGIDRNNDRFLLDETALSLTNDRQVAMKSLQFSPEGQLNLLATVSDFHVQIPATGVNNVHTQLLARLSVMDQTTFSPTVPVILDGVPPRVLDVRISPPGTVVIGTKLDITATITDDTLSGVEKVEATFDLERTGEFPSVPKPMLLGANTDGDWVAQIPSKDLQPGEQTLLIRATDAVGNVSKVLKTRLLFITPEEAERRALTPVSLSGVVKFGDQTPSGIAVSAKTADGKTAGPVMTNEKGTFLLSGLTPGIWKVEAKGLLRNKNRSAGQDVVIKSAEKPEPTQILLK